MSTHERRSTLEKQIQRDIEADLGAEPDLLLLRNSVGQARYVNEEDGKEFFVPYGLGTGSPDLVSMLRVDLVKRGTVPGTTERPSRGSLARGRGSVGVWFCLEVKCPGEDATPEQEKVHAIWRRFGAIVEVVHSVVEARDALNRARRFES